ncbi:hypothetical protein N0V88_001437 [Collariella sp. IMI 366227]|nr:hypothetical protein N0V88_001437 [Collariella sp. IMI 366227]
MGAIYASAGGTAAVGDKISYQVSGSIFTSPGANKNTTIYVPITNPQSQTDPLTKISVECKGNSAIVKDLCIAFGNTVIFSNNVDNGSKDFEIVPTSYYSKPDANPYGIDVSMTVNFSSETGTFELYSVTLQFGTA